MADTKYEVTEVVPVLAEDEKHHKLRQIRSQFEDSNTANQQERLLVALRQFPVSTIEARKSLDIVHPAGRIAELRRSGWSIRTRWILALTDAGIPHRVALYSLGESANDPTCHDSRPHPA